MSYVKSEMILEKIVNEGAFDDVLKINQKTIDDIMEQNLQVLNQNRKIIVLVGKSSTGKTQTLKYLIQKMILTRKCKLFDHSSDFSFKLTNYTIDKNGNMPDVWVKFCVEGKHIAVMTMGDSPAAVIGFFEKHVRLDCEVFVCACHDTQRAKDALSQKLQGYGKLIFVPKVISKNNGAAHQVVNSQQAQDLLRLFF